MRLAKLKTRSNMEVLHRCNWASEASPTLGCSIEISRDIYICMYICMSVCMSRTSN